MNCESSRELLGEYLDGELEAGLRTQVQGHLAGCDRCSEVYTRLRDQKADIRLHAPHYEATAMVQEAVRAAVHREADRETEAARSAMGWRWAALAASVLLFVSLGWNLALYRSHTGDREVLAENLLSSHIRSLIGTHLLDVPSSDQHTVKPWFNGKLDFSPEVKDFASQGFPLIGGRMEYLSGRAVAALVYHRRQHVINLFTWPSAPSGGTSQSRQGFHLIHWDEGGMTYWAIADIPMAELQQFRDLYAH